jgi:hypothetical protein
VNLETREVLALKEHGFSCALSKASLIVIQRLHAIDRERKLERRKLTNASGKIPLYSPRGHE